MKLGVSNPTNLATNGLLSLTNLTHLESLGLFGPGIPDELVNQFYKSSTSKALKISR